MRKLVWVAVFGVLAGSAAAWIFQHTSGRNPESQARAAPARKIPNSGPGTVTLAPEAAERMGLAMTVLKPVRRAGQLRATAVALSPQGLASLGAGYVAAGEKLAVARANLTVARNEYERQSTLYKADQTTSLKELQAARGALESSQARTAAAELQLRLDELAVEQQWGPVLREWLVARSPALERILRGQEWLVEVTLDARAARSLPKTVRLIAPSGLTVTGRFLSSFPQINPVIQGQNFLYLIPSRPGFAPGLSLIAEIPVGPLRRGVVIPAAAVVWADGQAWAYKEIASNHFQRFPVATDAPVAAGWFVAARFSPDDRVVTAGAEELFSAESQPATGGQGKQKQEEEGDTN